MESPRVIDKDVHSLTDGFSRFAANLYHRLSSSQGNLFFSPYNIAMALLLIHAGARGETRREIEQALGIDSFGDRIHGAASALHSALAPQSTRAGGPPPADTYRLTSSAGLWRQASYSCKADYLRIVQDIFHGQCQEVDFAGRPEAAIKTINRWAKDNTNGLIDSIVGPATISSLTRLILAGATYFKANWGHQFAKSRTETAPFHPLDGTPIDVRMMDTTAQLSYARSEEFEIVELPYVATPDLRCVILLPNVERFDAVERSLEGGPLNETLIGRPPYKSTRVHLRLPRFRMSSRIDLSEPMQDLGIRALFSGRADLSGISEEPGLQVDAMSHSSFVSVDEDGTEAAAVTAVAVAGAAFIPDGPVSVTVDRPFLIYIVDRTTRAILFAGRCMRPDEA